MDVEGKGRKREVSRVMRREERGWREQMRVLKRKGRKRCKERRGGRARTKREGGGRSGRGRREEEEEEWVT